MKPLCPPTNSNRNMHRPIRIPATPRQRVSGVTLIELMIALGFGLVLIMATLSIYLANKQTFTQVENLARLNENARIAFDLLGRDFREAGSTPCGNNNPGFAIDPALINWGPTEKGFTPYGKTQTLPTKEFGNATAQRVANTDAVIISSASDIHGLRTVDHSAANAQITLNKAGPGFKLGDYLMACNPNFATIFQITNDPANSTTIEHKFTGANCHNVLRKAGVQLSCTPTTDGLTIHPATIAKVTTITWYIANNGRGGRSLYRINRDTNTPEEMVEHINNMEIEYLVATARTEEPFDYVISTNYDTTAPGPKGQTAGTYGWWPGSFNIVAARVTLTLQTPENIGNDGQAITRQVTTVFNLRNKSF
jgi:type IV pilus assembly protein PilW